MGYIPPPPKDCSDEIPCAEVCCKETFRRYLLVNRFWVKQRPYCSVECEAWARALTQS